MRKWTEAHVTAAEDRPPQHPQPPGHDLTLLISLQDYRLEALSMGAVIRKGQQNFKDGAM